MYEIIFHSRFEKVFRKLDHKNQERILKELEKLAGDPFVHQNIRMIVGVRQKAFRLRVGRWRVIYLIITKKKIVEVLDLFIRKGRQDYKRL